MAEILSGTDRGSRTLLVTRSIENADLGWFRDARRVSGAVADWGRRFPNLPYVDDGETDRGRGTTAFDLVRRVNTGSILRFDWLSVKTATVEGSNKLPSKFHLCTGNPETVEALIHSAENGGSYPSVFFASRSTEGLPDLVGWALFADLGPAIRQYGVAPITNYPESGYARGKAPPFYIRWNRWQPSGVKRHQAAMDAGIEMPEGSLRLTPYGGVEWAGGKVRYSQFVVSMAALGVRRQSWLPNVHVASIPRMLDRTEGFGGSSEVTWDTM